MKARQIIADQVLDPQQLSMRYRAFDIAWAKLALEIGDGAQAIEVARMTLARAVLAIDQSVSDPGCVKTCTEQKR